MRRSEHVVQIKVAVVAARSALVIDATAVR
jgi:hypothetical protein